MSTSLPRGISACAVVQRQQIGFTVVQLTVDTAHLDTFAAGFDAGVDPSARYRLPRFRYGDSAPAVTLPAGSPSTITSPPICGSAALSNPVWRLPRAAPASACLPMKSALSASMKLAEAYIVGRGRCRSKSEPAFRIPASMRRMCMPSSPFNCMPNSAPAVSR